MLAMILFGATVCFVLAYIIYGKFLSNCYELNDDNPTPGHVFENLYIFCQEKTRKIFLVLINIKRITPEKILLYFTH